MVPSDYIHMNMIAGKKIVYLPSPCSASDRYGLVNLYNYYC